MWTLRTSPHKSILCPLRVALHGNGSVSGEVSVVLDAHSDECFPLNYLLHIDEEFPLLSDNGHAFTPLGRWFFHSLFDALRHLSMLRVRHLVICPSNVYIVHHHHMRPFMFPSTNHSDSIPSDRCSSHRHGLPPTAALGPFVGRAAFRFAMAAAACPRPPAGGARPASTETGVAGEYSQSQVKIGTSISALKSGATSNLASSQDNTKQHEAASSISSSSIPIIVTDAFKLFPSGPGSYSLTSSKSHSYYLPSSSADQLTSQHANTSGQSTKDIWNKQRIGPKRNFQSLNIDPFTTLRTEPHFNIKNFEFLPSSELTNNSVNRSTSFIPSFPRFPPPPNSVNRVQNEKFVSHLPSFKGTDDIEALLPWCAPEVQQLLIGDGTWRQLSCPLLAARVADKGRVPAVLEQLRNADIYSLSLVMAQVLAKLISRRSAASDLPPIPLDSVSDEFPFLLGSTIQEALLNAQSGFLANSCHYPLIFKQFFEHSILPKAPARISPAHASLNPVFWGPIEAVNLIRGVHRLWVFLNRIENLKDQQYLGSINENQSETSKPQGTKKDVDIVFPHEGLSFGDIVAFCTEVSPVKEILNKCVGRIESFMSEVDELTSIFPTAAFNSPQSLASIPSDLLESIWQNRSEDWAYFFNTLNDFINDHSPPSGIPQPSSSTGVLHCCNAIRSLWEQSVASVLSPKLPSCMPNLINKFFPNHYSTTTSCNEEDSSHRQHNVDSKQSDKPNGSKIHLKKGNYNQISSTRINSSFDIRPPPPPHEDFVNIRNVSQNPIFNYNRAGRSSFGSVSVPPSHIRSSTITCAQHKASPLTGPFSDPHASDSQMAPPGMNVRRGSINDCSTTAGVRTFDGGQKLYFGQKHYDENLMAGEHFLTRFWH